MRNEVAGCNSGPLFYAMKSVTVSTALSPKNGDNAKWNICMHKNTKLTPVVRKEIFMRWKRGDVSQRMLAQEYHVDKRVIGRIVGRGRTGDFSVHTSVNLRFQTTKKKRAIKTKPS